MMTSVTLMENNLHKTHINIDSDKRLQLVGLLNQVLACLIDLKLQVKQAHWNVKGMRFIALHELFDKLAEELEEHIDTVAERATSLGGMAMGTLHAVYQDTNLEDYPLTAVTGEDHLNALIERYGRVSSLVRQQIDSSDNVGDKGTSDIFTEVSRSLDLRLWFLEAHIQDKQ
jgi:starvation-inducible DNA-binding protein